MHLHLRAAVQEVRGSPHPDAVGRRQVPVGRAAVDPSHEAVAGRHHGEAMGGRDRAGRSGTAAAVRGERPDEAGDRGTDALRGDVPKSRCVDVRVGGDHSEPPVSSTSPGRSWPGSSSRSPSPGRRSPRCAGCARRSTQDGRAGPGSRRRGRSADRARGRGPRRAPGVHLGERGAGGRAAGRGRRHRRTPPRATRIGTITVSRRATTLGLGDCGRATGTDTRARPVPAPVSGRRPCGGR